MRGPYIHGLHFTALNHQGLSLQVKDGIHSDDYWLLIHSRHLTLCYKDHTIFQLSTLSSPSVTHYQSATTIRFASSLFAYLNSNTIFTLSTEINWHKVLRCYHVQWVNQRAGRKRTSSQQSSNHLSRSPPPKISDLGHSHSSRAQNLPTNRL